MLIDNDTSLPIDLLRTFAACAESGNFTKAAGQIGRTQSAVSMQIKRLEEITGRLLFQRVGRGVELSGEGRNLLDYARRILSLHDEALHSLLKRELAGRVRLGAPEGYAARLLPAILSDFNRAHPAVRVDVWSEPSDNLVRLVQAGRLDMTLCSMAVPPVIGQVLADEHIVWATSIAGSPHKAEPLPLAVFHKGCIYRRWALEALARQGRRFRIAFVSQSVAAVKAAVRQGLAVAPMNSANLPDNCRALTPEEGFPPLPAAALILLRAQGSHSPVTDRLAQAVVAGAGGGQTGSRHPA